MHVTVQCGSTFRIVPLSGWSLLAFLLLAPGDVQGQGNTLLPLPNKVALKEAEALIQDVFKAEFARAREDIDARRQLARTLLAQAREIKEEVAPRFVALREARDLAATAGDTATSFAAIAELEKYHKIDPEEMKLEVLMSAAVMVKDPTAAQHLAEVALEYANLAAEADRTERAVRLITLAEQAARKADHPALLASIQRQAGDIQALHQELTRLRPFMERLQKAPDDGEACQEVGRSLCLLRDRWEAGLPLLAKSKDPAWRDLARAELAQPTKPAELLKLAESWRKVAATQQGEARVQSLRRSYQWYQQAMPQLQGAERVRAEENLRALVKLLPEQARTYDIRTELRTVGRHREEVLSLLLVPRDNLAISGGADGVVLVWDLFPTGGPKEPHQLAKQFGRVMALALSQDGKYVFTGGEDKYIRMWDLQSGEEVRRFANPRDPITAILIPPGGKELRAAGLDGRVQTWELSSGKQIASTQAHNAAIHALLLLDDAKRLLTASSDGTLGLFERGDMKRLATWRGHQGPVLSAALSPDGRFVLSGGEDGTVRLWDIDSGKELRKYHKHTAAVGALALLPDGTRFLSASDDQTIRLWDLGSGQELRRLGGHTDAVYRVVVSPDGRWALSCSLDRTLRLWGEKK